MALNIGRMKEKQSPQAGGGFDKESVFRFQPGKNHIRIFKFRHVVNDRDFSVKNYTRGSGFTPKVGEVVEEICRPYWVHLMKGTQPVNCFMSRNLCERCREAQEMDKTDPKAAKMLRASKRFNMNVVNMDDIKGGMKILSASPMVYDGIMAEFLSKLEDGATEDEIFGANGRDFVVTYNKNSVSVNQTYVVSMRDKDKSIKLDNTLQYKVKDLMLDFNCDPQDAPPVPDEGLPIADQESPGFTQEAQEAKKPAAPATETTKARLEKQGPKKISNLKDTPKPGEYKVGDTVSFTNEGASVSCTIESIDGSLYNVRDEQGQIWQLDKTEIIPF